MPYLFNEDSYWERVREWRENQTPEHDPDSEPDFSGLENEDVIVADYDTE